MIVKFLLTALSVLILGAMVHWVPRFADDGLVYILSFGVVVGNVLFPMWFFQGVESMKYIAILNIVGEFIYAFFIFACVRSPQDYLVVPFAASFAALTTGILGQYFAFEKFKVSFKFPGWDNIWEQFKVGWHVFISVVAINAYTTTRVFAVGLLTNNATTGYFSIAERIANVAQTFPLSSFSQAIYPRLSKIFHKNKIKAFAIMQQAQLITINISLICLPALFLCAPWIITIVCGGNYWQAVLSLRLLLISVFFIAANAFRVQFLLVSGHTNTYSRIHVRMAMVGLPLIILLIHYFSYAGAAMATTAIEAGVLLSTVLAIKRLKF